MAAHSSRTIAALAAATCIVCGVAGGPTRCAAQDLSGYGDYTAWRDWARLHVGSRGGLASSYDRDGQNWDFSHYEDPPGLRTENEIVTARTIDGPGIVYRFWMPHLTADRNFIVRMYFDGEPTPRIDSDSASIFSGAFSYFAAPLVTTCAGGQVCYEPIPFATSLRIETENKELPTHPSWHPNRHYYQYTYATFPSETNVTSYTGTLSAEQQAARAQMVALFDNAGQHPAGSSPTAVRLTTPATAIASGECLTIADLSGPGLIRQLNVRMDAAGDAELNGLSLRVLYDGDAAPAIDVSVACFFGAGDGRAPYRSIPLGTDSPDGFYCCWPMPFRQSVLLQLCNTTAAPVGIDSAAVEYEPGPINGDACYLHAFANTSVREQGQVYHPVLSAAGCGHYVGSLLYARQSYDSFYMLEGDEIVAVDGGASLYGTGLEDAYNGGYYYNWAGVQDDEPEGPRPQSAIRPLHGILYVHRDAGIARADQYRWQIGDRVPFGQSLEVKIENRYAVVGAEWTSVAFWYQRPDLAADLDGDGDVDLDDFGIFAACFTGANNPPAPGCPPGVDADLDGDGDVDLDDFGIFAASYTGSL